MIDVAFACLWAVYAGWGLFAAILGVATITEAVSETYTFLWACSIGVFASLAALAATSLFFDLGTRLKPPIKKRIELWAVRMLICLIAVYPALLITAAVAGDLNRGPTAVIALSYLVMPVYRNYQLKRRIKNFERAAKEILTNGTI